MKNYRYLMNMGIAFDEDRILKKFARLAKEGWILCEMSTLRYKLIKDSPQDLIYSMDYCSPGEDAQEYYELFEQAGWKLRCSYGPFHFFSAKPGTVPIYTDRETGIAKYTQANKIWLKLMIISLITLVIVTLMEKTIASSMDNHLIDGALFVVGLFSTAMAVPSVMVVVAFKHRIMKKI